MHLCRLRDDDGEYLSIFPAGEKLPVIHNAPIFTMPFSGALSSLPHELRNFIPCSLPNPPLFIIQLQKKLGLMLGHGMDFISCA